MKNKRLISNKLGKIIPQDNLEGVLAIIQVFADNENMTHPAGYKGLNEESIKREVKKYFLMSDEEFYQHLTLLNSNGIVQTKEGHYFLISAYRKSIREN